MVTLRVVYDGRRIQLYSSGGVDPQGVVYLLAGALTVAFQRANQGAAALDDILRRLQGGALRGRAD